MPKTVDLIVIGGGSGGIASAIRAASHGASCVVIEQDKLGGTCVNRGCVPKKVMWLASELAGQFELAADYGFSWQQTGFDWAQLVQAREAYIERINHWYQQYLEKSGVTFVPGYAEFVSDHQVKVDSEVFEAPHIVIATGGHPVLPTIPGGELAITSDEFFQLTTAPKKVAVVGAGYIAVELAGVLNGLGCETHLVLRKDKPLRQFDTMLSDALLELLPGQGITIHTQHVPERLSQEKDNTYTLQCVDQPALAGFDCVLWAVGRQPNTQHLNLSATRIEVDTKGFIPCDKFQNTNVAGVYSLGDVTGRAALTPVAVAAGRRLATRLFGDQPELHLDYQTIPTVIFSHPPIGTIGLSETEAIEQYGNDQIKTYTSRFTPMLYALSEKKLPTQIKLITRGEEQKIIGCHLIGTAADEILQGFAVAIKMGARKCDFDNTIAIHPTSAEELVTLR